MVMESKYWGGDYLYTPIIWRSMSGRIPKKTWKNIRKLFERQAASHQNPLFIKGFRGSTHQPNEKNSMLDIFFGIGNHRSGVLIIPQKSKHEIIKSPENDYTVWCVAGKIEPENGGPLKEKIPFLLKETFRVSFQPLHRMENLKITWFAKEKNILCCSRSSHFQGCSWYRQSNQRQPTNHHQTFQVPKIEVLTYISCMDTAYVRENHPF